MKNENILMTKLHEKDFKGLTSDERNRVERIKQELKKLPDLRDLNGTTPSDYRNYRHSLSFFPNNLIDVDDLTDNKSSFNKASDDLLALVKQNNTTERDILNFIKHRNAYFIIASLVKNYSFGHHSVFVFPEFRLSTRYIADYLIIGKNSDGYHFLFVELENPRGNITLQDGSFGKTIRRGLNQIHDWNIWIEANFCQIRGELEPYTKETVSLPNEFLDLDKTRIHYAVIAGIRSDYNEKTRRLRREEKDNKKINILHYDNLFDLSKQVIREASF